MDKQLRESPFTPLFPVGAFRYVSPFSFVDCSGIGGIICFFWILYLAYRDAHSIPWSQFSQHITVWDDLLLFILLVCLLFYPAGSRYQQQALLVIMSLCVLLSLAHLAFVLPSLYWTIVIS